MAGDWIKIDHTLPDKPEVVSMAGILGIDQDAVCGKLSRIWIWADQNSVDGNGLSVTETFLDRITICAGFSAALRKVGWLSGNDGSLCFPNFDRHNGQSAKARAVTNRRVAKYRTGCNAGCNDNVTLTPLQKPLPEKRREDKNKGEYEGDFEKSPKPPNLASLKTEAERLNYPSELAERLFHQMEAVGWVDRVHRPVTNWKAYLSKTASDWRQSEHLKSEKAKLKSEEKAAKVKEKAAPKRVEPIRGFDE